MCTFALLHVFEVLQVHIEIAARTLKFQHVNYTLRKKIEFYRQKKNLSPIGSAVLEKKSSEFTEKSIILQCARAACGRRLLF